MLAGCGGSQPPIDAPDAMRQSRASALAPSLTHHASSGWSYTVLFKFGYLHGTHPAAPLLDVNGTLYGTTESGGKFTRGTVYKMSPSGAETVLHSFSGGSDGANPQAGLIDVNGTLYGTTEGGGTSGDGTVFSISMSGTESVLYSFTGGTDGGYPYASLIEVKGTLYGTTAFGGDLSCSGINPGCGTVYSITTSGSEKVLHSFSGRHGDGTLPFAPLIDVKGTLYGTTAFGGSPSASGCGEHCGTVYSISTAGAEKVLYSFSAPAGGQYPFTGLLNVNGTLYGTTEFGGTGCGGGGTGYGIGCGVVYSVSTAGKEKLLYSFSGGLNSDGAQPAGELLNVNGTLYGTTTNGGSDCGGAGVCGPGTIYSISTAGAENVLYRFSYLSKSSDGDSPRAGLIDVNGVLYGTTYAGGMLCAHHGGCGTVFTLSH
jgi:uncharacterized repeat protein (TIGR03803 family)